MNTTWKRFNIFISSTFKDMDFERDIIKFRVIPALNIKYRPRHVALQAIDLRLGVNTAKMSEEESARKVLTVCADNIDSARPFFIGLIGARYGWVPPFESWQETNRTHCSIFATMPRMPESPMIDLLRIAIQIPGRWQRYAI